MCPLSHSSKKAVLLHLTGLRTRAEKETRAGAVCLFHSTGEKQSHPECRVNSTYRDGRGISAHVLHDLGTETPDGLQRSIAGLPPTVISIFRSFYGVFFGRRAERKECLKSANRLKPQQYGFSIHSHLLSLYLCCRYQPPCTSDWPMGKMEMLRHNMQLSHPCCVAMETTFTGP